MTHAQQTLDFIRYQYLQNFVIKRHGLWTPAGQKAWKECEEIKNRNGGIPPTPPKDK